MVKEPAILVTGGAGYIGSHTCRALKEKGYLPVSYDNLSTGHQYLVKWGPLVQGELFDLYALQQAFEKFQPKAVLHFAASSLVIESMKNPEKYYQNNLLSTLNLLKVMREYNVKFLVFSSSCASYGTPKALPITEDFPQLPINPYGRTKKMIEDVLRDYDEAYGLKSASLRYFNAAGSDFSSKIGEDHKEETHLIPLIFDAAIQKTPYLKIYGTDFPTKDGSAIRDYIHVIDLADAHVKALEWLFNNKKSLFLNLGSETGFSVKEVLKEAEKVCQKQIPYQLASRREGDPPILIASSQKAKDLLGWKPTFSLSHILDSAWKWHQYLQTLHKKQAFKQEKIKEDPKSAQENRSQKKAGKLESFLFRKQNVKHNTKQNKKEKKPC